MLVLTTVALGGFRGLISNALWIRASDLQDHDKFFEMVQLADWITKLEPHFTQVWLVQAWNMAYNISVKFKDAPDRWRWVEQGIELLRDQGLRYNPHDVLIHRELAWFFQMKMGQNLDDAHMYYKQMWANEMSKVFGTTRPNWDELINPQTPDAKKRAALLRDKYKLDPVFMKKVDDLYGPMEWRLPEASAIYWAAQGLEDAKYNERKIDQKDLITLRRVIYQSMQTCFERGRLVMNKADKQFEFGPDLAIIPKTSAAYEQAMEEDAPNRDHIETAHRNFVRNAVFFLYTYNREADALNWFKYLSKQYPNKPLLDAQPGSMPGTLSLDDYAIGRIEDEVKDAGHDKAEGGHRRHGSAGFREPGGRRRRPLYWHGPARAKNLDQLPVQNQFQRRDQGPRGIASHGGHQKARADGSAERGVVAAARRSASHQARPAGGRVPRADGHQCRADSSPGPLPPNGTNGNNGTNGVNATNVAPPAATLK